MEELKVKNVIIGKQFEDSENLQKFIEIVNEKKVKVYVVEAGQRINIEKNLYFNVLWPDSNNVTTENVLNNNSLVCKLVYKNFSMMFTGDIEEKAEKQIVSMYDKSNILNSTVLKVAHHGSKTSTTQEFLEAVSPQIALVGAGRNNLYGHPNSDVLNRLKERQYTNL